MLPHTGHWAASIARAPTTPSTPTTVRPGAEAARPQPQSFLAPNGTISTLFASVPLPGAPHQPPLRSASLCSGEFISPFFFARTSPVGSPASPWICLSPPSLNLAHRMRSEEHTSELQSHLNLVCRLLLEKK